MRNMAQNTPWVRTEREGQLIDFLKRLNTRKSHDTANSDTHNMSNMKKKKAGEGGRRGERFQSCHEALSDWRRWRWRTTYRRCIWGMEVLLPDKILEILAKAAHIKCVDDIRRDIPEWEWVDDYGVEVLDRLRPIDNQWKAESTQAAEANKAKRRRTSEENKAMRDEARRSQKHLETLHKRAMNTGIPGPSRHPLAYMPAPPQATVTTPQQVTVFQWAPNLNHYHSTTTTLPTVFQWMPLENPSCDVDYR